MYGHHPKYRSKITIFSALAVIVRDSDTTYIYPLRYYCTVYARAGAGIAGSPPPAAPAGGMASSACRRLRGLGWSSATDPAGGGGQGAGVSVRGPVPERPLRRAFRPRPAGRRVLRRQHGHRPAAAGRGHLQASCGAPARQPNRQHHAAGRGRASRLSPFLPLERGDTGADEQTRPARAAQVYNVEMACRRPPPLTPLPPPDHHSIVNLDTNYPPSFPTGKLR
jgi:hypothetical protein